MAVDLKALKEKNLQAAVDLTKPQESGEYAPPAIGVTRLRFVGYIEKGTHTTEWQKVKKTKKRATLIFELSGAKHAPREFDGRKVPHIIKINVVISNHVKSGFIKLFKIMSNGYEGATNFLDLLGNGYRGTVSHRKYEIQGQARVAAELKTDAGYQIHPLEYEDPETGELKRMAVEPAITPLQVFLWDIADCEQWDSIFIDGTTEAGKTRNVYQEEIKRAEDFIGSPIFEALVAAGRDAELERAAPDAPTSDGDESEDGEGTPISAVVQGKKALDAVEEEDPLAGVQ